MVSHPARRCAIPLLVLQSFPLQRPPKPIMPGWNRAFGRGFRTHQWRRCDLFIYSAVFIGFVFDTPRLGFVMLATLLAILGLESWLFHLGANFWITGFVVSIGVGVSNVYMAEKNRANRKLRRAQEEIEHLAKVAEREPIARDLHDVLGTHCR